MAENESGRGVRLRAEWAAVIEAQERSCRSAKSYCVEQGISYSNFLYHRRNHRERLQGISGSSRAVSVSGGFIPIHVNESAGIRLRFPMGLVLESDRIPSAAWVVEVARRWTDPKGPRSAGGEDFSC